MIIDSYAFLGSSLSHFQFFAVFETHHSNVDSQDGSRWVFTFHYEVWSEYPYSQHSAYLSSLFCLSSEPHLESWIYSSFSLVGLQKWDRYFGPQYWSDFFLSLFVGLIVCWPGACSDLQEPTLSCSRTFSWSAPTFICSLEIGRRQDDAWSLKHSKRGII